MTLPGRIGLLLLVGLAGFSGSGFSQEESVRRNEAMISMAHGSFGSYPRSDDRLIALQYYLSVSPELKVFGEFGNVSRFDLADQPFGGGVYWKFASEDYLYACALFAVNPDVVAKADLTAEYTRVLLTALTGSVGYRAMIFPDETVHILVPGVTLYTFPGWTIIVRSYVSRLASVPDINNTLFLRVRYDWSDRFASIVTTTTGSETYRAGSLEDFSSAQSWSIGIEFRVQLSETFRVHLGYEYLKRIGTFQENSIILTPSFSW
jgi:YaiO family outer membrane protein